LITMVSEPSVPELDGLQLSGRSVAERSEITPKGVPLHRRLYRFELRPTRAGRARIGSSSVQFTLATGETRSLNSAPLTLEVQPPPAATLMPTWASLAALGGGAVGALLWLRRRRRPRPAPPPDPLQQQLELARAAAGRGDRAGAGDAIYRLLAQLLQQRWGVAASAELEAALERTALEAPLRQRVRETLETLRAARYGGQPADAAALERAESVARDLIARPRSLGRS
jgi:hypothetical protein